MTPEQRLDFKLSFILEDFSISLEEVLCPSLDGETRRNLEFMDMFASQSRKSITERIGKELMAKAGYVYLIKTYGGFYKIGETKDPRKRLKGITGPVEEIIHKIQTDDCKRLETYLHNMHVAERRGQEIFVLSEEDVANICRVKFCWYEGQGLHNVSLF